MARIGSTTLRVGTAGLTVLTVLALAATPASAALQRSPNPIFGANGTVRAVLRVGGTVFLGGDFTALVNPANGATTSRSHIAAVDAASGTPLSSWNPGANASVYALAASPNGATLYFGGEFTSVAGRGRSRLAAVSAGSGALVGSFAPSADGIVMALQASASRVFVGGKFTHVNSASHSRLAAVDASNGALVPGWNPSVAGTVRGLALSQDGGTLFLCGGGFQTVSGQHRSFAAAVQAGNGSLLAWAPNPDRPIYAITTDASKVYAAAGGSGGHAFAWSASSGAVVWQNHTDGDADGIAVVGSQVVLGGHFTLEQGGKQPRLVAFSASTGAPDLAFNPSLTGGSLGAIALASDGTHLVVGGDFTRVNGASQPRLTQFTSV